MMHRNDRLTRWIRQLHLLTETFELVNLGTIASLVIRAPSLLNRLSTASLSTNHRNYRALSQKPSKTFLKRNLSTWYNKENFSTKSSHSTSAPEVRATSAETSAETKWGNKVRKVVWAAHWESEDDLRIVWEALLKPFASANMNLNAQTRFCWN